MNILFSIDGELKRIAELRTRFRRDDNGVLQVEDIVRLTYHSNALSGSPLSYGETEALIAHGLTVRGASMGDILETSGYAASMRSSVIGMSKDTVLLETDFTNLHRIFFEQVDAREAGVYRREPVFVRLKGTGEEHYFPDWPMVPALVKQVFSELGDLPSRMHPVDRAAKLHYRLVSIHPFVDGNGRAARLLMNVALMQHGYPPTYIPAELRDSYIDSLMAGEKRFVEFCRSTTLAVLTEYADNMARAAGGKKYSPGDGMYDVAEVAENIRDEQCDDDTSTCGEPYMS